MDSLRRFGLRLAIESAKPTTVAAELNHGCMTFVHRSWRALRFGMRIVIFAIQEALRGLRPPFTNEQRRDRGLQVVH